MTSILDVGAETAVNSVSQTNGARDPTVARLDDGGYIVVWRDDGGAGARDIYAQRYDADGDAVGGRFLVAAEAAGEATQPFVTGLSDGGYVVGWTLGTGGDGSGTGVYLRQFDSAGVGGDVQRANTATANDQDRVAIAGLEGGGYVVTWQSLGQDGSGTGVYAQLYDSSGDTVGGEVHVSTSTAGAQGISAVAAMDDGGYLIVWNGFGANLFSPGVFVQRYDATGNAVGGETQLDTLGNDSTGTVAIATLTDGSYVASWTTADDVPASVQIHSAHFNAAGGVISGDNPITVDDPHISITSHVAALSDGGYVIAWMRDVFNTANDDVYLQRFDSLGNKIGPETLVSEGGGYNGFDDELSIAGLDDGGFVVSWTSRGQAGNLPAGIFQKVFAATTDLTGSQTLIGTAGNDTLDGGAGADILYGGVGDDTYVVDNAGDVVKDLTAQGNDTVQASLSYSLTGSFVEALMLTGTGDFAATGNSLDNTLSGNAGANTLTGGYGDDTLNGLGGADTMTGGKGDDTYWVDNSGDVVIEGGDQGVDSVTSSVTFSLSGQAVENLYLSGSGAINGTGNSLANTLSGNTGNNVLDGGYGADLLHGGSGADTFLFKTASGADTIDDFSAVAGDTINLHAYTHGTVSNILAQSGGDVVITLGGGNVVTVLGATVANVTAHIVW